MTPTIYWRLFVALALAVAGWYVVHTIRDNAKLTQAVKDLSRAVTKLDERQERMERAQVENQRFDDTTNNQATQGVLRNESLRRENHEVVSIDKPWPIAMRRRVFDNPDPASGSTAAASTPAARTGGRDAVPVTR